MVGLTKPGELLAELKTDFLPITGQVFRKDLVVQGRKLENTVTELTGDEKNVFLDFASSMLQWLPEKRKTAKELLLHAFFDSLEKERERYLQAQKIRIGLYGRGR